MNAAGYAGANLNGFHVTRFADGRREQKIPENIRTVGGHGKWLGQFYDEVGRAELPSRRESWLPRRIGLRAPLSAGGRPGIDELDLRVRQAALIGEVAIAMLREPGWHIASPSNGGDLRCTLEGIGIGKQR